MALLSEKRLLLDRETILSTNKSWSIQLPAAEAVPAGPRPYPVRLRKAVPNLLYFLLPSFIQQALNPSLRHTQDPPPRATAFLDGIRGLASLFVFFHHFYFVCHNVKNAYGAETEAWLAMPILRLLICGHAMVSIFFVVSGYSLSVKPLRQMRHREWHNLQRSLSSSIVRRPFRLFLPCLASTLCVVLLLRLRVFEYAGAGIARNPHLLTNFRERHPVRRDTLVEELDAWARQMFDFMNPWTKSTNSYHPSYDSHLWSVSTEYRASMMMYVVHLGVARFRPAVRRTVVLALIFWCMAKYWWTGALFFSGFMLADLDSFYGFKVSPSELPHFNFPRSRWQLLRSRVHCLWRTSRFTFWAMAFTIGLYLASAPAENFHLTIGFQTLGRLTPSQWAIQPSQFWSSMGAILIVSATANAPLLQAFFTSPLCLYLGKISFAIYLVHGTVVHTIGYACLRLFWDVTSVDSDCEREIGFAAAAIVTFGAVIWSADVFTRAIDIPSRRLALWIDRACVLPGADGGDVALVGDAHGLDLEKYHDEEPMCRGRQRVLSMPLRSNQATIWERRMGNKRPKSLDSATSIKL